MANQETIVIERLTKEEWETAQEIREKIFYIDIIWSKAMLYGGFPFVIIFAALSYLKFDYFFGGIDIRILFPLATLYMFSYFAIGTCVARLFLQYRINAKFDELYSLALDPKIQTILLKLDSLANEAEEIQKMNSVLLKLDSSLRIRKNKINVFLRLAGIRHRLRSIPLIAP